MLRSGSQGWRAGSMAALGIGTGTMVHVLAAALGLSALLSASAELFAVIKLMGALYLVYLGVSMLWQRSGASTSVDGVGAACALLWAHLGRGCSPMSLNPKVAPFSRLLYPSSSPRCAAKGDGIHRAGLHLQFQRHDLVPSVGVFHRVCKPQGATTTRVATWLNRVMGLFVGLVSSWRWSEQVKHPGVAPRCA